MPKAFIHFTFLLFFLTGLSGMWMRLYSFSPNTKIIYTNILHGHSHLAILGWAFLGVFIVFLKLHWNEINKKNEAKAMASALFITSSIMFIAFLYEGYGLSSIIMSTVHIFVEYWVVIFIYRQLNGMSTFSRSGSLFIKGSLITLIISTIGPFSLGFISASGLKESYLFDMAIYFYLHFQYNGWLFLFLIGLFIIILQSKRVPIQNHLVNLGFWIYFITLFPGYFASVLWVDLGSYSILFARIGSFGQWIGVLCILIALKEAWHPKRQFFSKLTYTCLAITFLLLFGKSTMELGLLSPAFANLIYDTRSVVIGYLHFTLLGFFSIFILTQFQMVNILEENGYTWCGVIVFLIGFFMNELLLFSQGLFEWINLSGIPAYSEGLLIASFLLVSGILILWASFMQKT